MTILRTLLSALALLGLLAGPAAAASKSGDEAAEVVRFIDLPPMSAAVLRDGRVRGLVTVQMTVELLKPEKAADLQSKLPRVQATLLNAMQRQVARMRSGRDLLDVEAMLSDMQRNADIVVGDGVVRPLIQNVDFRR